MGRMATNEQNFEDILFSNPFINPQSEQPLHHVAQPGVDFSATAHPEPCHQTMTIFCAENVCSLDVANLEATVALASLV
jgi:hypothetical protein